jgi:two-component system chemotaxis response regulator CheY
LPLFYLEIKIRVAYLALIPMTHTSRCNNVLVVEDDRDIREAISEGLTIEGYRVTTASNGKEALDLLRKSPDAWKPCFILLDLMMPVMNGWEFLLIQGSDPLLKDIPVIVCSAVGDRTRFPGVVEFLNKPLDFDDLIKLISKHCDPSLNLVHSDA